MGDNKKAPKSEVLALITERLPLRMTEVGEEISWAFGISPYSRKPEPPEWVRRTIRCFLGAPAVAPKDQPPPKLEDLVAALGMAKGMAAGGRVWANEPLDTTGIREDLQPAAVELKQKVLRVIQPQIQKVDDAVAKIPSTVIEKNHETLAAFTRGQSEGVEAISEQEDEGTITQQLLWFLWMFWPEIQTAKNVRELHEWIGHVGLVQCSMKLVEKVCGRVGLRPSQRGRKKRIPTTRD